MKRWIALVPLAMLLATLTFSLLGPGRAWAQEPEAAEEVAEPVTETAEVVVEVETAGEAPIDFTALDWDLGYTINSLIMFLCAVLVLFMQAGFAMLEVGLNSQKHAVNILFKNIMDLSVGVLLYLFIGWGLMYHDEGSIIEGWLGYEGPWVQRDAQGFDEETGAYAADPNANDDGTPYASSGADFLFQVAFAATAATIVSGAVAGRMKFHAYLVYSAILTGLVYPISGYWKWGGGALDGWGFQDFAGSIVVHAVGGFAALAGAIILGARTGRFKDGKAIPMPGHNLTLATLGVFILWIGWYGFNPGSQLTYNGIVNAEATTYIALTTTIAAASGVVSAMTLAWILFGKPDLTMALNGALAGLVGITANCDRVSQSSALIIGLVAGILVVAGIIALEKLHIDDPVGAFPVHGLCGVWGGLATGFFGSFDDVDGIETRMDFIMVQAWSTLIICAWAFLTMAAVFLALKAVGLLRVTVEEEIQGLDLGEHGMQAYTIT